MPQLSIIIPAYNAEKTIAFAIDSVLNQNYDDYELIVVDDGSVDNTPQIIDEYAAANSKIRPVHRENGGQAVARGHGLSLASGQWVLFLDSDDSYVIGAFDTLMKHTECSPDFILFGFNVFSNKKLLRMPNAGNLVVKCSDEVGFRKIRFLMASACNKMYKRSYIKVLFDKSVVHGEDRRFNYQNLTKDTVIVSIADCLYNVNLDNEGSVNKSYKPGRFFDTVLNSLIEIDTLKSLFPDSKLINDVYGENVSNIALCAAGCQKSISKDKFIAELKKSSANIDLLNKYNNDFAGVRFDLRIIYKMLSSHRWEVVYYTVYQQNNLLKFIRWLKNRV